MRAVARPYMVAAERSVRCAAWSAHIHGEEIVDIAEYPDWDYFTAVRLKRRIHIDWASFSSSTGIENLDELAIVVTWKSSWTGLRGATEPEALVEGDNVLAIEIPGESLGGQLVLETQVLLRQEHRRNSQLVAKRQGSILWSDLQTVSLEGQGSRFPLVALAFSQANIGGGRSGLWSLAISTDDLESSALGALRVHVNAEHRAAAAMLQPELSDAARLTMQFMYFDIARQLLSFGIEHEDLDLERDFGPDSLGAVLVGLARVFEVPLQELRARYRFSRGDLEAELQARLGLLKEFK